MSTGPFDQEHVPADPSPNLEDQVEELLFECLGDQDPTQAITKAADDHPELADKLRCAYGELLRWNLVNASERERANSSNFGEEMPERLGEYRLIKRIGAGGMGVVYLARDDTLNRTVALKLIRPEHVYVPGARERFQHEVETIAKLQHPGIVPIYGVGKQEGMPYFTMQHIRGCSIAAALAELQATSEPPDARALLNIVAMHAATDETVRPQSGSSDPAHAMAEMTWPDTCVTIAIQIAGALQHAHERGILHRDVKPSNVLMTSDGRALLLDFGLAWSDREGQRLTKSTSQLGSLPYMPPEHISGDLPDPNRAADIYSLGVTLYEMLTLHNPFLGKNSEETRRNILGARTLRLRREQRSVSWELETVCLAAMDPDPTKRYPTMLEFQRDLERVRDRQTIQARRPSLMRRATRWAQRHPSIVAAMAVAFFGSLVALSVFGVQQRQARVESDQLRESAEIERYGALVSNADVEARIGLRPQASRQLLAQCREQDRGFEWRHLEFVTDQATQTLQGFSARIQSIEYCPDNQSILVSTQGSTMSRRGLDGSIIWSLSATPVSTMAICPANDGGHVILCGLLGGSLQVRDLSDGSPIATFEPAESEQESLARAEIVAIAASRDGRRAFSASSDGRICEWDAVEHKFLRVLGKHDAPAQCLALNHDGTKVASGGFDRTARVFDTETGEQVVSWKLPGWCLDVAWAPDQHTLLIANQAQLQANDLNQPEAPPRIIERGVVLAVECSDDGELIAATVSRRALQVYRVAERNPLKLAKSARLVGHEGLVQHLCFSPNGDRIASGSSDIRLWNAKEPAAVALPLHRRMVTHLAFAAPGLVVSADSTGRMRASSIHGDHQHLATDPDSPNEPAHDDPVVGLVAISGGVMSVDADGTTIRWQRDGNNWTAEVTELAVDVVAAATLANGDLVLACDDGRVLIPGTAPRSWQAHEDRVTALAVHGNDLWTGALDGTLKKWDATTGDLILEGPTHPSWIGSILVEPNGSWVATGGADTMIRVLDNTTSETLHTLEGHGRAVVALATDASGSRLISSGGYDNELRFWQPTTGRCLLSIQQAKPAISVAFDAATDTLALGDRVGYVRHLRSRPGGPRPFAAPAVLVDTISPAPGSRHR